MKYGFGIDVGGTTVKIGFFEDDVLTDRQEIPTRTEDGGKNILPDIAAAVGALLREKKIVPGQVEGIGIGVPGPVSREGVVNRCVNLNWGVFNIHEVLGRLTGIPFIRGGNDANCAALGECWKGGGQGVSSALLVTLGTGVGGGIVIDGKILNGAHGSAGEVGHITVSAPDRAPCTCGKFGCLEQYASATGIVRVTKKHLAESDAPSSLRSLESITCRDVFDAAKAGDAFAKETLEEIFHYMGEAFSSACCVCNPQRVIIGGGVSKAGDYLLDGIKRHFYAQCFHACNTTEFSLATLGNDAGMYGAYRLLAK